MTWQLLTVLAFSKDSAMEWVWQIGLKPWPCFINCPGLKAWLKPGAIDAKIHWALAQMESLLEKSKCRNEHRRNFIPIVCNDVE